MFLVLNHQKLDVYKYSRSLVTECYKLVSILPHNESLALSSQIRRAAVSVQLNIAEGASRKSQAERKRFYEIARSSLVELDAAMDILKDLDLLKDYNTELFGKLMIKCFVSLTSLIKS